jgi:hypothetical protein
MSAASAPSSIAFTFPEKFIGHTTYREPPYHLIEDFKKHLKETGQPETFPGLYWGRLRANEPFEILADFAVDLKKRPERNYVPCPMCKAKEKFLEGSLVFVFSRRCIAIIGHDCAAAEVRHEARSKKKQADKRQQQEDFLLSRLQRVPGMLKKVREMIKVAGEIESIHRAFRRGAPDIQRMLREVRKNGGELKVTEVVENDAATSGPRTKGAIVRDHNLGHLIGAQAVASSLSLTAPLRALEQWLIPFDGCRDEHAALDKTIQLLDINEAEKAVDYIGEADRRIAKLTFEMAQFCQFFSAANIDGIRNWAVHPLQQNPFEVERQYRSEGVVVTMSRRTRKETDRQYARLVLPDHLADWAHLNLVRPRIDYSPGAV